MNKRRFWNNMGITGRVERNFVRLLGIGILFGFGVGYILFTMTIDGITCPYFKSLRNYEDEIIGLPELGHGALADRPQDDDPLPSYSPHDVEARRLAEKIRVLCLIMTNQSNPEKKAVHIHRTWGRKCNKLFFMSSIRDPSLPSVPLNYLEEDSLWAKTKGGFRFVYENHLEDADWFLKADDDTFVIMENLRYMLKEHDATTAVYFGCRFKADDGPQSYMAGGAGYVMSKEALKRFVNEALTDETKCRKDNGGMEDVKMGVELGNSLDTLGRHRFMPLMLEFHVAPEEDQESLLLSYYRKHVYFPQELGPECCSDTAITFRYNTSQDLYKIEYLLYHLRRPYSKAQSYTPHTKLLPITTYH